MRELFLVRLREFYREPAVLFWVYGFPLFLAIGLGLAFSGGEPEAPAVDIAHSPEVDIEPTSDLSEVKALQQRLQAAGVPVHVADAETCRKRLRTGESALYIVPTAHGYQYFYDPARADSLIARYRIDDIVQRWKSGDSVWQTSDALSTEPGSRYIDFLIPGLMGMNLMTGGLWGVGYVIVDMRVRRLLKRLLATPMRASDFLLSILGSRVLFIIPEMLVLALAGHWLFATPIRGNPLTLAVVILFGSAAFASLGLLLACRTERTETVSGLINLIVLPMWMLCGTFFSPKRFPDAMQPIIHALPLTQLNDALRAVMLEDRSLAYLSRPLIILLAWAIVPSLLALRFFKWH